MDHIMFLKVFIDTNDLDIVNTYTDHITNHNDKLYNDAPFEDSGFDIFIPSSTTFNVRLGGHSSGTWTFNGTAAGRIFGGVMSSSITITEITV